MLALSGQDIEMEMDAAMIAELYDQMAPGVAVTRELAVLEERALGDRNSCQEGLIPIVTIDAFSMFPKK